jgi:ribosomal protein L37AE/L43A
MDSQVHQLSQLTCNYCGQVGIIPRTETYEDRFAQERVTEAVWVCHRCGQRFNAGVMSREKINE